MKAIVAESDTPGSRNSSRVRRFWTRKSKGVRVEHARGTYICTLIHVRHDQWSINYSARPLKQTWALMRVSCLPRPFLPPQEMLAALQKKAFPYTPFSSPSSHRNVWGFSGFSFRPPSTSRFSFSPASLTWCRPPPPPPFLCVDCIINEFLSAEAVLSSIPLRVGSWWQKVCTCRPAPGASLLFCPGAQGCSRGRQATIRGERCGQCKRRAWEGSQANGDGGGGSGFRGFCLGEGSFIFPGA